MDFPRLVVHTVPRIDIHTSLTPATSSSPDERILVVCLGTCRDLLVGALENCIELRVDAWEVGWLVVFARKHLFHWLTF
jgi:hypothetical protein